MPKPKSEQVVLAPYVIGVVGSRRRNTPEARDRCIDAFFIIVEEMCEKGQEVRIVSGGCPLGGDSFAEEIAKNNGLTITIHYPNWKAGKFAGFSRNTKIAEDCDILLALPASDRKGGTEDTIKKALKLGKAVIYA